MADTSTTSDDMSIDQAVQTLLGSLPAPIQEFVLSPERSAIALSLSKKYDLHVDQAGAFERAYIFMLLGIYSPEEFVADLKAAAISPESVQGLTADVNEQVFMKLRREEEARGAAPAQAAAVVTPATIPSVPPPTPVLASVPSYSAPTQPVPQPMPSQPIAPATPAPAMPAPTQLSPTPRPLEIEAPEQFPEIRTMTSDMAAVTAGETPHATNLPSKNAPASVWEPTPSPVAPVPPIAPPPQPVMPPAPTQPSPKTPSSAQNENRDALHAVLKSYGIDPYREPPE